MASDNLRNPRYEQGTVEGRREKKRNRVRRLCWR